MTIYGIDHWTSSTDFLEKFAKKSGRLLKGGEPDIKTAARMLIYDWQRGKIPYYNLPPNYEETKDEQNEKNIEKSNDDQKEEIQQKNN